MAEALRLNTTLASIDLGANDLGEGGGSALAKALRLNTTVTSLNLGINVLGKGGGRRAEGGGRAREQRHCTSTPQLCPSTFAGMAWERAEGGRRRRHCASVLNLSYNDLGEGGGQALAEALRLNITVTSLNLGVNGLREEVRSALRQVRTRGGSLLVLDDA